MIYSLLAAAVINTRDMRVLPRTATPAAAVRESLQTKLDGTISSIRATSIVVNGTTVNILTNTVLIRRFGAKSLLTEFTVGDEVQVVGKWTDTTKTAINARVVRDLSIQKRKATFVGIVSSLFTTGFVLTPQSRPAQIVTVPNTTKYIVGHKIMVRGVWDTKANTLTEVSFVRDYSLPTPTVPQPKTVSPQQ